MRPWRRNLEAIGVHIYKETNELLAATSVPASLQLAAPWIVNNLALMEAGADEDGPFAAFSRIDPGKAGHLIQWCAPPPEGIRGIIALRADIQATGEDAAGINLYCYFHPTDDSDRQVFQLAHPGDGQWHTLSRAFPLPARPIRRMRVMLVSRFGDGHVAVRNIRLRFTPDRPGSSTPEVSDAFREAVLATVARHPASGDPEFREKLYRSLISGNRKGRQAIAEVCEWLRHAGFTLEGGRFLDLGCGTGGAVAGALAAGAAWAEGWEITPEKLELARVNLGALQDSGFAIHNRNVEEDEALGPEFVPFGLVFCQEVLEHVKDIDGALRTLARCIDPERGAGYVTVPSGFSLEAVLRDPHLQLFGITLLDRFEAQPLATALKNHTHYSKMMGSYYRHGEYVERFEGHGLIGVPLRPADTSKAALKRCKGQLEEIQAKRFRLRKDWGKQVDETCLALLESRLDDYLDVAEADFVHATDPGATEEVRLRFVQHYGLAHLEFIVAHRESRLLASP